MITVLRILTETRSTSCYLGQRYRPAGRTQSYLQWNTFESSYQRKNTKKQTLWRRSKFGYRCLNWSLPSEKAYQRYSPDAEKSPFRGRSGSGAGMCSLHHNCRTKTRGKVHFKSLFAEMTSTTNALPSTGRSCTRRAS